LRGRESTAALRERGDDLAPCSLALPQPSAQRGPFDELHRDEPRVPDAAHLVDRDDVGVRELRHRLRLALQALRADRARGPAPLRRPEQLERDVAIELWIGRPENDPHPAVPDHAARDEPPVGRLLGRKRTIAAAARERHRVGQGRFVSHDARV
jgi:hypothetical protein